MKNILKLWLVGAALLLAAGWVQAQATVYTATSVGSFTGTVDFVACGIGPCQNYNLAMGVSGSFTTSSPLASNLAGVDISASVTSFNFTDGINTYASSDPTVALYMADVSTNATGAITGTGIVFTRWQTGTSPHVVGDRHSYLQLYGVSAGYNNAPCGVVGVSPTGIADTCKGNAGDGSESAASGSTLSWARAVLVATPQSIPTLSQWSLIIVSSLVGFAGFAAMRRKSM